MNTGEEKGLIDAADNLDEFSEEDKSSEHLIAKPWDPKDIRITTKTFTIREIYNQITEKELDLAPDFQRSFVWTDKQQVRLVESILLGIPLPAFYFNQDMDGAHQVIDGVQRLTTIKHFMSDKLSLKREYLDSLGLLGGHTFSTLEPLTKRRFAGTQIVAHVIEPQTPDAVKYDIFNRVNTGGSPLSAQEIRHCMSKRRSREFLRELVESPAFDKVMGRTFWKKDSLNNLTRDNKRMTDREMALRFCAFYSVGLDDYAKASSLDTFLLEFTRLIDTDALDLSPLSDAFKRAMENCNAIMADGAFRLWPNSATRRGPLNRAIFESQALALSSYSLVELLPYKKEIQTEFRKLFSNEKYLKAVSVGTGDSLKVSLRINEPRNILKQILP